MRTILVVDDQQTNRKILKKLLCKEYRILEASNGKEAIEILHQNTGIISAILLDLMMPIMNGFEMLEKMMQEEYLCSIPVIVASQAEREENELKALDLGARDFILKPYQPLVLKKRLANLIELYEANINVINLKKETLTDKMTGLGNRVALTEHIKSTIRFKIKGNCCLIMLDIDDFKKINDEYGHDVGDEAICNVAKTLKSLFREDDLVCRMGGDEFAVFVKSNLTKEQLAKKLDHLIQKMQVSVREDKVTCSVGVAMESIQNANYEVMYKKADIALFNAKNKGKNCYSIYEESLGGLNNVK